MKRLLFLIPLIIIIGCPWFKQEEDYFPLAVNNKWEYSLLQTATSAGTTDTMMIGTLQREITGKDKISDEDVFVLITKDSVRLFDPTDTIIKSIDTAYIRETKDLILTYETKTATPETTLKLPLKKDKTWTTKLPADTVIYTVKDQEDITVPAGTYKKCWKIERKSKTADVPFNIWLADGTGMVKASAEGTVQGATIKFLIELKTKPTIK